MGRKMLPLSCLILQAGAKKLPKTSPGLPFLEISQALVLASRDVDLSRSPVQRGGTTAGRGQAALFKPVKSVGKLVERGRVFFCAAFRH